MCQITFPLAQYTVIKNLKHHRNVKFHPPIQERISDKLGNFQK